MRKTISDYIFGQVIPLIITLVIIWVMYYVVAKPVILHLFDLIDKMS